MTTTSIYATPDHLTLHRHDGTYAESRTIAVPALPEAAQSIIAGSLAFLPAGVLAEGETVDGPIILTRQPGAVRVSEEETRDQITADIPVARGTQTRTITQSSEVLPAELRDGLLGLWVQLDGMSEEQLAAMAP